MSIPQHAVQLTEPGEFLKKHPETQFVDLLTTDTSGVVHGRWIGCNSLDRVFERDINLPASLFVLDITGSVIKNTGLDLDIGDADRICCPILGILSTEPWQRRPTTQLLMIMHKLEGESSFTDPREVLHQAVTRLIKVELTIVAAFGLEFYLINRENVNGRPQPPRLPISGKCLQSAQVYSIDGLDEYVECLQDIIDGTRAQGIPVDTIVAESAPVQFEVNFNHVNDALKACDYAVLLKYLTKNIAYDHGTDIIFMARPYPGQAEDGLHVHISLLDKHGDNILTSEDSGQSATLCHAIGSMLETLLVSIAFLCSNTDSYCRFGSQFRVPNVSNWGLDNRAAALRVLIGSPDAVHLEHHVAGADANPYLLLTAILVGAHHGLTDKIEPGASIEGGSYEQMGLSLPNSLRDALRELDESEIMTKYIDPKYIGILVTCKENELEELEHLTLDLEYNWYLYTA